MCIGHLALQRGGGELCMPPPPHLQVGGSGLAPWHRTYGAVHPLFTAGGGCEGVSYWQWPRHLASQKLCIPPPPASEVVYWPLRLANKRCGCRRPPKQPPPPRASKKMCTGTHAMQVEGLLRAPPPGHTPRFCVASPACSRKLRVCVCQWCRLGWCLSDICCGCVAAMALLKTLCTRLDGDASKPASAAHPV